MGVNGLTFSPWDSQGWTLISTEKQRQKSVSLRKYPQRQRCHLKTWSVEVVLGRILGFFWQYNQLAWYVINPGQDLYLFSCRVNFVNVQSRHQSRIPINYLAVFALWGVESDTIFGLLCERLLGEVIVCGSPFTASVCWSQYFRPIQQDSFILKGSFPSPSCHLLIHRGKEHSHSDLISI